MQELLIIENDDECGISYKNYKKRLLENYDEEYDNILESIKDNYNYHLKENEKKYKIFEDISSINSHNKYLELVLDLPINLKIVSINKIKFSDKIKDCIENIYLTINNKKTVTDIQNINLLNIRDIKNLEIHLLLKKNAINKIINKNIYITYSYIETKSKIKFY